jgi:hypothetical protein
MLILKWEKSDEKFQELTLKAKFLHLFSFLLFSIFTATLLYLSYIGIFKHLLLDSRRFYISETGLLAPAIFFLPFPFFMVIAIIQKVFNYKIEQTFKFMIKTSTIGIALFFVSIFVCSFYIEANLKKHGYTYCSWYKFSPTRSPDVWLKDSRFCLKEGAIVALDVEKWFEYHDNKGIEPQLNELKVFITKARKEQGR